MKIKAALTTYTAVVLAWIGVILTLMANFFCTFTVQDMSANITDEIQQNTTTIPIGFYYAGVWNYKNYNTVFTQNGDTVYVNTFATCSLYPEGTEVDTKWKTSQAFTIISAVIAVITALLMTFKAFSASAEGCTQAFAGALMLTSICQGLSLIFLSSNACASRSVDLNAGINTTTSNSPFRTEGTLSTCKLSSGGIMAATALCVWFFAAVFAAMSATAKDGVSEKDRRGDVESGVNNESAEEKTMGKEEIMEKAPETET